MVRPQNRSFHTIPSLATSVGNLVMSILDQIVETKRREVAALAASDIQALERAARLAPPTRGFLAQLKRPGMQVIAEIKKASPSAGVLRDPFDPAAIALSYASAGAACLSVLTDIDYFQGSLANLRTARNAVNIPVLRKDFLIDPLQVIESRAAGADAILLIAEILDSESLKQMHELAQSFGMDVLVEMHDVASLEKIKTLNPPLAGVNNRDLNTFVTRLDHSLEMRPHLPAGALVVSESGIREPSDITKLMAGGIKAVLVGETFMRAPDPGARLSWLLGQSA